MNTQLIAIVTYQITQNHTLYCKCTARLIKKNVETFGILYRNNYYCIIKITI